MKKELCISLKVLYVVITFTFFLSCERADENKNLSMKNNEQISENLKSNKLTITSKDGNEIIFEAVKQSDGTFIIFNKKNNDRYFPRDFNLNFDSKLGVTISDNGIFIINNSDSTSDFQKSSVCYCVRIDNNETIGAGSSIPCDPYDSLFLDEGGRIGIRVNGVMLVADLIETCLLEPDTVQCLLEEEPAGTYCIDNN